MCDNKCLDCINKETAVCGGCYQGDCCFESKKFQHPIDILEDCMRNIAKNNNLELVDDFEEQLKKYKEYMDEEVSVPTMIGITIKVSDIVKG